ncbi:MAG: glycosyltransferase [Planctomycetaceae bacterium]|nr:glycosyltransferase [Planctomycetaceae bacterium]
MTDAMLGGDVALRLLTTLDEGTRACEVKTQSLCIGFPRSRPRFWYSAPALPRGLREYASDATLLHLHEVWSHPQYAAAKFAAKSGIPHILTPHGELGPKHLRHKGPLHHLKKRIYLQTAGRRVVFGAACLHVFTEAEAEGLSSIGYRGPVVIVPNGIELSEFALLPEAEEAHERWPELTGRRVVLYMSRLSPEKGLCRLIPAWKEVVHRQSLSDAMLVLAGPNDRGYGDTVERLIGEHGIGDHVLRIGLVTGQDRLRLLSRADVYTLPSFSEGFSMSLLEAMACGKVAVFTPGCNFPEAEQAGAGICVEPDVGQLRDALVNCLELNDDCRTAMGLAAKMLVQSDYTWDAVAAKLRTVYQCVVDGTDIPRFPQPFIAPRPTTRQAA